MIGQPLQYIALIEYAGEPQCVGVFSKPIGMAIGGVQMRVPGVYVNYGFKQLTKEEYETYAEFGIPVVPWEWTVQKNHGRSEFHAWLKPNG